MIDDIYGRRRYGTRNVEKLMHQSGESQLTTIGIEYLEMIFDLLLYFYRYLAPLGWHLVWSCWHFESIERNEVYALVTEMVLERSFQCLLK
jgi:hypothetical protein